VAKKAYQYDKSALQEAIRKVESEQKPATHGELWKLVAAEYNIANKPQKSLQAGTARNRAEQWNLEVTTAKGERGQKPKGGSRSKPKPASKPAQVHDTGGPGFKPCHNCGKFYGVRISHCPACGAKYKKQPKPKVAKKPKKRKPIEDYPVFDEGGKGRKECSNDTCGKFYFTILPKCPKCGTEYVKPDQGIKTYDGPGRMRKQCPECKVYVGYSAEKCACGHDFAADVPDPPAEPEPKREPKHSKVDRWSQPTNIEIEATQSFQRCGCGGRIILAPAGGSPAKLESTDEEAVQVWHDKVMEDGHSKGNHYSPAALRYFVAFYHFDRNSDEYAEVCEVLRGLYARHDNEPVEEEELIEA